MKKILLVILALSLYGCAQKNGLMISDEKVICTIDRGMTRDQLQQFKTELWEKKKIQFDINELDFNQNKQISRIKISVDCNDGFKGSAQTVFKNDDSRLSFYRIYDKKVSSPFGVGGLPD